MTRKSVYTQYKCNFFPCVFSLHGWLLDVEAMTTRANCTEIYVIEEKENEWKNVGDHWSCVVNRGFIILFFYFCVFLAISLV